MEPEGSLPCSQESGTVSCINCENIKLLSKQASSSLLLAFASMVILGVEPHRDPLYSTILINYSGTDPKENTTPLLCRCPATAPERTPKKTPHVI
jgi:hypothetical protein